MIYMLPTTRLVGTVLWGCLKMDATDLFKKAKKKQKTKTPTPEPPVKKNVTDYNHSNSLVSIRKTAVLIRKTAVLIRKTAVQTVLRSSYGSRALTRVD